MDWLVHVANVLFLFSYLVKDILWLRLLSVVAGLALLAYFFFRPDPLWVSVAWNVVFTLINAYQIHALLLERRPVNLSDDEQRLYQLVFRSLTRREFVKLVALARWEEVDESARIVERGRELDRMMVIYSGRTRVEVDGRALVTLLPGQFVGEMISLTGQHPQADVVAAEKTRFLAWKKSDLTAFLRDHPSLRAALQSIIGTDLVGKLRAA